MHRAAAGTLLDREVRQVAGAGPGLGVGRADRFEQRRRDLACERDVLRPQAPCAVDRAATFDDVDSGAGEREELACRRTHVLRAAVTGGVPRDGVVTLPV